VEYAMKDKDLRGALQAAKGVLVRAKPEGEEVVPCALQCGGSLDCCGFRDWLLLEVLPDFDPM
jgi:hypothetical protein